MISINPIEFYNEIAKHGIELFTGVPDSLLKEFCLCVEDRISKNAHIITVNEGNAIGIAAGHYLAKKSIPLVYMQNSGLGNAINPLLTLCDPEVYSIPMLLMIGWRGEPGVKDEPQHVKQGMIQIELMKTLGIPFEIISKNDLDYKSKISKCIEAAKSENRPTALLIKKGTFGKYNTDSSGTYFWFTATRKLTPSSFPSAFSRINLSNSAVVVPISNSNASSWVPKAYFTWEKHFTITCIIIRSFGLYGLCRHTQAVSQSDLV